MCGREEVSGVGGKGEGKEMGCVVVDWQKVVQGRGSRCVVAW